MELEILYPQIYAFHNALSDTDEFIEKITESEEFVDPWHDWYSLGKQTLFKNYPSSNTFKKFPNKQDWDILYENNDNPMVKQISNIFYETTKIFVEQNNIDAPSWTHECPAICTHNNKKLNNANKDLAMTYHTDFRMAQRNNPGFKHWITANIYINENYEGGNISFKIFKNKERTEYDFIDYKPKAGDMLIFPSTEPYYHGVKKTSIGEKYFIRMFWGYWYEGSSEWLANQEKYGEEIWKKMDEERAEREENSSMWHLK